MMLSKHFSLEQMVASTTAQRKGIDNTPDPATIERLRYLCSILDVIHEDIAPIIVTSGYRSPKLNRAVGGQRKSQHMLGEAADIEVATTASAIRTSKELWLAIRVHRILYDQLILEFHDDAKPTSGWVHISCVSVNNRKQMLRLPK